VLLATQSFWEGVDVPGEGAVAGGIDRIRSRCPTIRCGGAHDRIRGRAAIPSTRSAAGALALALKQGFGRLHPQPRRHRYRRDPRRQARAPAVCATLLAAWPRRIGRATESIEDVPRSGAPAARSGGTGGARMMLAAVILCVAAYLVGSIPTGSSSHAARGVDLRAVGQRQHRPPHSRRAMGRGFAIAVLVGDALRGFLPVSSGGAG